MKRSVRTYVLVVVIIVSLVVLFLPTSVGQGRKPYEVPTQIYDMPAWHSDAAHTMDAYERLMDRYTDLTERNMAGITADLETLARKLDAIDAKLTALDARLARVEQFHSPASVPGAGPVLPSPPQPPVPVTSTLPVPTPPACVPSPAPGTVEP
jgi:hypothetical protein